MKDFGFTNDTNAEFKVAQKVAASETSYPKTAYVTNCNLVNIRKEANKNSTVISKITKGCEISVTGDKVSGFYPIKYSNITGFIMADYLEVK